MDQPKPKAVAYCRVSTTEQSRHGVSLDAQKERIRAYCTMAGFDLVQIFVDDVSGGIHLSKRPAGAAMLAFMHREGIENLIALKLDRVFRNAVDALNQTEKWNRDGIALHVVDMGGAALNASSAMGRMFLTVASGFAELERALISERTASALQHKKERLRQYSRRIPFGYDLGPDKTLIPNPIEQAVIDRIRTMRAEGLSFHRIAAALNAEGVATKEGRAWHPPTIRNILNNPIHAVETAAA